MNIRTVLTALAVTGAVAVGAACSSPHAVADAPAAKPATTAGTVRHTSTTTAPAGDAKAFANYVLDHEGGDLMDVVADAAGDAADHVTAGDFDAAADDAFDAAQAYTRLHGIATRAPGQDTATAIAAVAAFDVCDDAYYAVSEAIALLDVDGINDATDQIGSCNEAMDIATAAMRAAV